MINSCSILCKNKNYTILLDEVIDYIVKTGDSVCAGNGENSDKLREAGVTVHAYDVKSIKGKVQYGINGLVENFNDDNILLMCSGFDCERLIKNFKGDILIIGGFIEVLSPGYKFVEYLKSLSEGVPTSFDCPDNILFLLKN